MTKERHQESLEDQATHILEECRMVLPGIQALFGFQFVAVYNSTFHERLTGGERVCHLVATGFVAVAVALVMTPAAYHRQVEPDSISKDFVRLSTRVLTVGMFMLKIGTCLDFYLLARLTLDNSALSLLAALALYLIMCVLWFVFPRFRRSSFASRVGKTMKSRAGHQSPAS